MITNKDIRVENGFLIINGDKYPLDGQSPEAIMEIVEDNSDTTPTENSTAPVTSGGVYTALGTKQDTLTFDTTPTDESTNPVTSGGVYTAIGAVDTKIGDLTQTGVTGASVAAQIETLDDLITALSTATQIWEGFPTTVGTVCKLTQNYTNFKYLVVVSKTNVDHKTMLIPTSMITNNIVFSDILSAGAWDTTTNAFAYNSSYGIKFTAADEFTLEASEYNNSNWVLRPLRIFGIG